MSTNNRVSSSTNNNNVVAATGGATADARPKESAGFGGLKQGFLVNTTNPKDNDKRTNETRNLTERNICGSKKIYNKDMPFIKAKHESRDRNLEFPEVQQAMKLDGNVLKNKGNCTVFYYRHIINSLCKYYVNCRGRPSR